MIKGGFYKMINFEFSNPTKVIFGKKTEMEAGKQINALGGHRVLPKALICFQASISVFFPKITFVGLEN